MGKATDKSNLTPRQELNKTTKRTTTSAKAKVIGDVVVNKNFRANTTAASTRRKRPVKKQQKAIAAGNTKKPLKLSAKTPNANKVTPVSTKTTKVNTASIQTPRNNVKNSSASKVNSSANTKTVDNKKTDKLKLPLFRRLHFKPSHVLASTIVILLAIFFGRVAIWEHDYLARMEGSERHVVNTPSADIAGEEEVDRTEPTQEQIIEYTVAPDKPRYLSIPNVGIHNARIVEVGANANGEVGTPYNIYDVGWYTSSALPGSNRTSLLDGHGGAPGIGVFGNLTLVQPGSKITIEMGDGRKYVYRIVDTVTLSLGEEADNYMATSAFVSPERGTGSITLVTCTGDYWMSSRTYSHRFFARAILESE